MPALENGGFDDRGQLIPTPPTPPQEPQRYGLAIGGIQETLKNGIIIQSRSSDSRNEVHDEKKEVQQAFKEPVAGNIQPLQFDNKEKQSDADVAPISVKDVKSKDHSDWLRRASSETSAPSHERQILKTYADDTTKPFVRSPDPNSFAVLSPALSEHSINSDGPASTFRSFSTSRDIPDLQSRRPSLNLTSGSVSREQPPHISKRPRNLTIEVDDERTILENATSSIRPRAPRALSTPVSVKSPSLPTIHDHRKARATSRSEQTKPRSTSATQKALHSPAAASIPMPPLSLSTYLQLELSSQRPPQAYISRPTSNEFPFESSRVKIERLLNFLFLPHQLEGVLWFGVLACLDVWLYTFTILPLRMLKSIYILIHSWIGNMSSEAHFIADYIYVGSQRMYHRRRTRGSSAAGPMSRTSSENHIPKSSGGTRTKTRTGRHHRRMKSVPSTLQPDDKADILKGLLIIMTCTILLRFDASRMYHYVRGQAAIKLYVIYNLLEVCDRLLSAIGQDVLECLFSREALERKPDGHSKVLRPAWLFVLALAYCIIHATALFFQVVTLNVAVNSYSNALVTLLMSNQFVEIKGSVFKKFERDNLFQLTCADIVERFQLWHMLMIIASRNIVVDGGGSNFAIPHHLTPAATATSNSSPNITQAVPFSAASILPRAFTMVPSTFMSFSTYVPALNHLLGPFFVVLGSEMLIDWLKHAYINKFNNTKPVIYGRYLDVLAKDYYINAFGNQNLTKRLGLPVIPLSCLMIRAGFQTYQMVVASWVSAPSIEKSATLSSIHEQFSTTRAIPTSTTAMLVKKMDDLLSQLPAAFSSPQAISYFTTAVVMLLMFLVLLAFKLILGMGLLAFSRSRYESMKQREHTGNPSYHVEGGKRFGGWGVVELDDEKRRIIYEDDPAVLQALRAKEAKEKAKREQSKETGFGTEGLEKVQRFEMVAKRIW